VISDLEAILLGTIQGLTEFLPVSSSGHLAIAQLLFGMERVPLLYDVLLHLATLLSIVLIMRQQVFSLLRATVRLPEFTRSWFQKGHLAIGDDPQAWTVILILWATAVTGAIGVAFHDFFERVFHSLWINAVTFALTGVLLWASRNFSKTGGRSYARATLMDATLIGLAQGLAILPALSRSASTITCMNVRVACFR
jgi:undecaprenyl-diphosphatase